MVYMPSKRIYEEMVNVSGSIFFVPNHGDSDSVILLKCPSNILKAVIKGCAIEIVFGMIENGGNKILCHAAQIYDDPSAPFIISNVQRNLEEHVALSKILKRTSTEIFLFDELSIPVSWGVAALEGRKDKIIKKLVPPNELYCGDYNNTLKYAHNCLDKSLNPDCNIPNAQIIPTEKLKLSIGKLESVKSFFSGVREICGYDYSDPKEGKTFEVSCWAPLKDIFEPDIYRSPLVEVGDKVRELTDILCFSEHVTYLFELKSIAVYSTDLSRTTERRLKNLHNQIKKALSQLKGAIKRLKNGCKVTCQAGNEIALNRKTFTHAIVVVSELIPSGDWDEIVRLAEDFYRDTQALVHIVDLKELIRFVMISKQKMTFEYNLIKRFEVFIREKNIFIGCIPTDDIEKVGEKVEMQ